MGGVFPEVQQEDAAVQDSTIQQAPHQESSSQVQQVNSFLAVKGASRWSALTESLSTVESDDVTTSTSSAQWHAANGPIQQVSGSQQI